MHERLENPIFTIEEGSWVLEGEKVDIFRDSVHPRAEDFVAFACPQNDWLFRGKITELAKAYAEYRGHIQANHVAKGDEKQVDTRLEYVYKTSS